MKKLIVILFVLLSITNGEKALALEVRDTLWGFDGQVVPHTFNLLSVLIANTSPFPFDGRIVLDRGGNFGAQGASGHAALSCYLGPGESRWVQFYPFFDNTPVNDSVGWTLAWGAGVNQRYDLDAPKLAAPANVWLADPQEFSFTTAVKIKRFPENLFPSTVSATDGLNALVLDHAPRWEAVRRAAFLDWVRRGGTLHLLPDMQGHNVEFSDELAVLNTPLERQRIGAGSVIRHQGDRAAMLRDMKFFSEAPAAPTLEKGKDIVLYDLESSFFRQLASMVRARVNWTLISWMTVFYLFAISFGHYFWAKRLKDYRLSLIALVIGVTVFAFLFAIVGRRGQGEHARVNTLAWAKALDPGRYDVMQWSNIFVTDGGVYPLTHPASHNLYSAGASDDLLKGIAFSGLHGNFAVEMPLFSSSAVLHRGVMTGDRTDVTVSAWESDDNRLQRLSLVLPPSFPTSNGIKEAYWVQHCNRFYPLQMVNNRLELSRSDSSIAAETFLSTDELSRVNSVSYSYGENDAVPDEPAVRSNCQRALIASCLGGSSKFTQYLSRPTPSADQAELIILADEPKGFMMQGINLGSERGLVVYQQTLLKPMAQQPPP